MRAHHLAIRVRSVERVAAFYRDVLQLKTLAAPRSGVVWFQLGEMILMIEPHSAGPKSVDVAAANAHEHAGLHLLSLAIAPSERETWEQRLQEHGVAIVNRTDYTLYFHDPEGNRLALSHYPERVDSHRE